MKDTVDTKLTYMTTNKQYLQLVHNKPITNTLIYIKIVKYNFWLQLAQLNNYYVRICILKAIQEVLKYNSVMEK